MTAPEKDFLLTLAYLFLQNSKYDRALIILHLLLEFFPEDVSVRRSLSYALVEQGQYEEGLMHSETVLSVATTAGEKQAALLLKSRALWGMQQAEEARAAYAEMRRIGQEARAQLEALQAELEAAHGVATTRGGRR